MSYVLIDGKRYYKDDRTGRVTLDNVSQAEADRRAQRNKGVLRNSGMSQLSVVNNNVNNRQTTNPVNTAHTVGTNTRSGFPWKAAIICAVIVLFVGAFFYNRFHVSSEEQAINNYMNEQQDKVESDMVSLDSGQYADVEYSESTTLEEDTESAVYLMPDSAERYLEESDIDGYSHDEIQMIINEIYARHGREFHTQDNIDYFSAQDWYELVSGKSDEAIVSEFNEYEKANVELLCKYL